MLIFILAADSPPRGVLRAVTDLGARVVVARPRADLADDHVVPFVHVTARGDAADPMDLRWSRKALRSVLRDIKPDLLHIVGDPWTPTAEAGAAAARDLKIPYLLVGTSSVGGPKGITARWQSRRVVEGAAALAGVTRPALDHLANGDTGRPLGVLPQGGVHCPTAPGPRVARKPLVFGASGRLTRERGVDILLDALSETFGDWCLRVAGTGPAQEALEAQAQRFGLSARIDWIGALPRDERGAFWQSIDVLVVPSRATPTWVEPTGQFVIEAMAEGILPIVTRSGALPGVVGESGLIVDCDDCPALARALQGALEQPSRAMTLGHDARRRVVDHFSDQAIARALVSMWDHALGRAPQLAS